jgi:hypothetical protein
MTVLPDGWCPGLADDERLARLLLDQRHPELCFHLVDDVEVRASLARVWPGHLLPDVLVDRRCLLEEYTAIFATTIGYLADGVLGLTAILQDLQALEAR